MELVVLMVGVMAGLAIGWRLRRTQRVELELPPLQISQISDDGVPDAPIEVRDDEIGHRTDGTVMVRQSSARLVTAPGTRMARGSVPPPFARTLAGELVGMTPRPATSVDEGWDIPQTIETIELD